MRQSKQATLRRTWITSALQLVPIIVGLGALAVGTTWYSRTVFHETTSHVEIVASVTALKTAIVEVSKMATPVIYGFESTFTDEENLDRYDASGELLSAEFAAAQSIFRGESRSILDEMVETWHELDTTIRGAPARMEAGAFTDILAAGDDPFVLTVWAVYNGMDLRLSELSTNTVSDLHGRISDFDRADRADRSCQRVG